MYSLKEAAEATGRGKPAILKAIQKGRISATKNAFGEWKIDPAELHRVYPPISASGSHGNSGEHREPQGTDLAVLRLEADLALKEERIRSLEKELRTLESVRDDLREDRDHWRKQAQQTTALLTYQQEQGKGGAASGASPSSFWQKLSKFLKVMPQ